MDWPRHEEPDNWVEVLPTNANTQQYNHPCVPPLVPIPRGSIETRSLHCRQREGSIDNLGSCIQFHSICEVILEVGAWMQTIQLVMHAILELCYKTFWSLKTVLNLSDLMVCLWNLHPSDSTDLLTYWSQVFSWTFYRSQILFYSILTGAKFCKLCIVSTLPTEAWTTLDKLCFS
jgi:hypothetical protein